MPKTKTRKEIGYLLSVSSPLAAPQRKKLVSELHTGAVSVMTRQQQAKRKRYWQ